MPVYSDVELPPPSDEQGVVTENVAVDPNMLVDEYAPTGESPGMHEVNPPMMGEPVDEAMVAAPQAPAVAPRAAQAPVAYEPRVETSDRENNQLQHFLNALAGGMGNFNARAPAGQAFAQGFAGGIKGGAGYRKDQESKVLRDEQLTAARLANEKAQRLLDNPGDGMTPYQRNMVDIRRQEAEAKKARLSGKGGDKDRDELGMTKSERAKYDQNERRIAQAEKRAERQEKRESRLAGGTDGKSRTLSPGQELTLQRHLQRERENFRKSKPFAEPGEEDAYIQKFEQDVRTKLGGAAPVEQQQGAVAPPEPGAAPKTDSAQAKPKFEKIVTLNGKRYGTMGGKWYEAD